MYLICVYTRLTASFVGCREDKGQKVGIITGFPSVLNIQARPSTSLAASGTGSIFSEIKVI